MKVEVLFVNFSSSYNPCHPLASYPVPAQLSVASSTVKWERAWYLSHVSDVGIERVVESV